jgi:hypothetical protein
MLNHGSEAEYDLCMQSERPRGTYRLMVERSLQLAFVAACNSCRKNFAMFTRGQHARIAVRHVCRSTVHGGVGRSNNYPELRAAAVRTYMGRSPAWSNWHGIRKQVSVFTVEAIFQSIYMCERSFWYLESSQVHIFCSIISGPSQHSGSKVPLSTWLA